MADVIQGRMAKFLKPWGARVEKWHIAGYIDEKRLGTADLVQNLRTIQRAIHRKP